MKRTFILLILIILFGSFLRLYRLTEIPPMLHYDEASFAYNAYSLATTGKDEFGDFMPANIRAFDDWRSPGYTYLLAGLFALFGPQDVFVRLPSALAGLLLIPLMYAFATNIGQKRYALLAAFVTSINPQLIILSRSAFDSNVALTTTVFAVYCFMKGCKTSKDIWLIAAIFSSGFTIGMYQSSKVFLPLLFLGAVYLWRRELGSILYKKRAVFNIVCSLIIVILLLFPSLSDPHNLYRFTSISIFNQEHMLKTSIGRVEYLQHSGTSFLQPFANRRILFFQEAISRYLDTFNPAFLFAPEPEPAIYYLPNFASFSLFEVILCGIGAYFFIRNSEPRMRVFILFWLFLVSLPSAFLSTAPQITRILPIIPILILFITSGWFVLLPRIRWPLFGVYGLSILYMSYSLFLILPIENVKVWQGNYGHMVREVNTLRTQYTHVYVSNTLEKPYITFLWHLRYDPHTYLVRGRVRGGDGLNPEDTIENVSFIKFTSELFSAQESLYVGLPSDFPQGTIPKRTIGCESAENKQCIWFVEDVTSTSVISISTHSSASTS